MSELGQIQMTERTPWNFDMSAATRGKMTKIKRVIGRQEAEVEVFAPDLIIAAGRCGVVTVSRWLPKAGRWCMFTKDAPPVAWQPFPEHPGVTE